MGIYSFGPHIPVIPSSCYIADGAQVIGKVTLGENVSIWHNTVLRGDVNFISVGDNSNVQDLSMLHITAKQPLILKENVTIGHSVTLHSCTIEKNVLVGMGAVVLDGALIGEFSIVAAGAVVPPNKTYPPRSLIMGAPAKVVRPITDEEEQMLLKHYLNYVGYKDEFKTLVKRLD